MKDILENGGKVLDFAADGGNLYFLVSATTPNPKRAPTFVLRASGEGSTIRQIRGLPDTASNIDVHNDQIIVRDVAEYITFDLDGRPNPRIRSMNQVDDFCAIENGVLGVNNQGAVYFSSGRETHVADVVPGFWRRVARAGDGRFAIIHGAGGHLSIGSLAGGAVQTYTPDTPLIAGLRKQFPPMASGLQLVLFVGIASDAAGDLFITLSGTQLTEGTPVLQFGVDGSHKGTRRYQLPEFAEFNEASGHRFMAPEFIGIDNGKIVFVDGRGAVAVFDLRG